MPYSICLNCSNEEYIDYLPMRCDDSDPHFSEDPRIFSCESNPNLYTMKKNECMTTLK